MEDERFNEKFKAMRNRLRSITLDDFLFHLIGEIHNIELKFVNQGIEKLFSSRKRVPSPWILLHMLKFSMCFCGENTNCKPYTNAEYFRIYNMVDELECMYQKYLIKIGIAPLLTSWGHQQFMFQEGPNKFTIARLNYLFKNELYTDAFHKNFYQSTGIQIDTFILILCLLFQYVSCQRSDVIFLSKKKFFSSISVDVCALNTFFNLISWNFSGIKKEFSLRKDRVRNPFLQFGEESPFILKPIISIDENQFSIVSGKLFEKGMSLIPFSMIKKSGDDVCIEQFALAFERYVGERMDSSGIKYSSEKDIQSQFDGKTPDYAMVCDRKALFVECKSTILSYMDKANPGYETIVSKKDPICTAIKQGNALAGRLMARDMIDSAYILIITYDDYYFCSPERTWNTYLKNYFIKYKNIDDLQIPIEHIFIVGISEFEKICSCMKSSSDLIRLIEVAVQNNLKPETANAMLRMHIDDNFCTWY